MRKFFLATYSMYRDGFRSMTVGRSLWLIIAIKLAIIFLILRIFLFPDKLHDYYDSDTRRARVVRESLTK